MNFNLAYEDGLHLLLPHLSRMRGISELICLKAEMELLERQRDKAWETVRTALKMSSQLKTEPILISQLVYFACNNIYLDFISYNLPRHGISDEQAGKLIAELAADRTVYSQSMKKAIDAERICFGGWVFERTISGRLNPDDLIGGSNSSGIMSFINTTFIYRLLAKRDYLEYLKIIERYKTEYDRPYFKLTTSIDEEKIFASLPKYCSLTRLLCPALVKIRLKIAEIATRSQEIRLRLALEEYKNLKGAYPDKIEELSPQFLAEIPVSDVTGNAFEYSKENDGYKISSGVTAKK